MAARHGRRCLGLPSHWSFMSRSLLLLLASRPRPRWAGPDRRGHLRRRRADRPGHGSSEVMANLQQLTDVIGPACRLARDAPGQRLDRRAVPGVRPAGHAGGIHLRRDLGARPGRLSAHRARSPEPSPPTAGPGRRAPGARRCTGPVVLADLSTPDSLAVYKGKVQRGLGPPAACVPALEPGRAADDRRRFGAAQAEPASSAPLCDADTPPPPCSRGASSRSTCRTCSRPPGRWAPWSTASQGARGS